MVRIRIADEYKWLYRVPKNAIIDFLLDNKSEDSVRKARTTFVDYDVASNKGLQYVNDMGGMGFTRWIIGMQQVMVDIIGEHPARVAASVMLGQVIEYPNPFDAWIFGTDALWNRVGSMDMWAEATTSGVVPNMALGAFDLATN